MKLEIGKMNRQTRRNFITCVAGGAAVLLTGVLSVIPFNKLKQNLNGVEIPANYEVIYVDTDFSHYKFASTWKTGEVGEDFIGGVCGQDLELLTKFEEDVQKDGGEYYHRYLIVNNKEEYGFLATKRPCWNFRKPI